MSDDPIFFDRETYETALRISRDLRRSNPRRVALSETLLALHRAIFQIDELARAVDDRFFTGYRDVEIEEPVFIVANPRSGTTFLHRLMCLDERYFYLKLYHTIFPAVSLFKLFESVDEADTLLGGLFQSGIDTIEEIFFSGWEEIHPLGFDRAEEDEGIFVLAMLSTGLYLLFPEISRLPRPAAIDDLSASTRRRVMRFYESCLKRVNYVEGPDRQFLGKTVLIPGRIHSMLDQFPDARFIHLVRHPYKTIPSFVSMFRRPWYAHSPEIADESPQTKRLADLAIDYYRRMHEARERIDDEQMTTVHFDRLVGETKETIEGIYDWLGYDIVPSFEYALDAQLRERRDYSSSHDYSLEQFGLTRGEIYARLRDVFEAHGFEA